MLETFDSSPTPPTNPEETRKMTTGSPLRASLRAPLFLALGTVAVFGCWQKLDSNASHDTPNTNADPSQGLGGPFPINVTTPDIGITAGENGDPTSVSQNACDKVESDFKDIRMTFCSMCHQDIASGTLTHIEDDASIVNVMSGSGKYPGMKYIVPGDPLNSLIYKRVVMNGDMPPPSTIEAVVPHPSISDMSVLRQWIFCLTGSNNPDPGGGSTSSGAGGATGSTTTGAGGKTGGGGSGGTAMLDAGAGMGMGADAMADSGMTNSDSGMTRNDGGAATPCTGVQNCNNPTAVASLPFNTTVQATQNQACFEVNQSVTGVNCNNATGRRVSINGTQVAINNGSCAPGMIPAPRNGGYCVLVNSGFGGGGTQPGNTALTIL